jgi:hypothetical protein
MRSGQPVFRRQQTIRALGVEGLGACVALVIGLWPQRAEANVGLDGPLALALLAQVLFLPLFAVGLVVLLVRAVTGRLVLASRVLTVLHLLTALFDLLLIMQFLSTESEPKSGDLSAAAVALAIPVVLGLTGLWLWKRPPAAATGGEAALSGP